jgi:serine/threonine protein kinase
LVSFIDHLAPVHSNAINPYLIIQRYTFAMECFRDNNFQRGVVLDNRFKTIRPLNSGSFGMVFVAEDLTTGEEVAIKCLTKKAAVCKEQNTTFAVDEKSEELACHGILGKHTNIVNLVHSFETENHNFLVLEFCSRGDLYEAIRTGCGPLKAEHVKQFMFELVDAVEYIHSKGMYHRDIKPENIFLAKDGTLKLGDFGLATRDTWSYETAVGSDRYMAPEQYDSDGDGYSPAQADIWAIGIILLNILFSRNPFTVPNESDLLFLDFSKDKYALYDVFPTMAEDTFQIILTCMSLDPTKRSLTAVREALGRAVQFTLDEDDMLDDFRDLSRPAMATGNREPLRTPSLHEAPPVAEKENGSFPWAKAFAASPPQAIRQLSAIPDTEIYTEDLFPESEDSAKDWFSVANQTPSTASMLTSSFGNSMQSFALKGPAFKKFSARHDLAPISGSLPISMTKPKPISMASVFGKKEMVSKSWSEMYDEDFEEEEHEQQLRDRQAQNARTFSHEGDKHEEDITVKVEGLSEPEISSFVNTQTGSRSIELVNDIDSDNVADGFFFQDAPAVPSSSSAIYSPPSKRNAMDKWSALGARRRAYTGNSSSAEKPEFQSWRKGGNEGSQGHLAVKDLGAQGVSDNKGSAASDNQGLGLRGGGLGGFGKSKFGFWSKERDLPPHLGPLPSLHHHHSTGVYRHFNSPPAKDQENVPKPKDLGDFEWVGYTGHHVVRPIQL